jgi:hypothetical protein
LGKDIDIKRIEILPILPVGDASAYGDGGHLRTGKPDPVENVIDLPGTRIRKGRPAKGTDIQFVAQKGDRFELYHHKSFFMSSAKFGRRSGIAIRLQGLQ